MNELPVRGMNMNDMPDNDDYGHRCWSCKDAKFFYIQPFHKSGLSTTYVELFLDNNVFCEAINSTKPFTNAVCIKGIRGINVNPYPALVEQWLSNPQLWSHCEIEDRKPRSHRVQKFVKTCEVIGVNFEENYDKNILSSIQSEQAESRYNIAVLFGFIAIIKTLYDSKIDLDKKIDALSELSQKGVPNLKALLNLGVLAFYFQKNRKAIFKDTGNQVVSHFDSFFAFKSGEGDHITERYLRNRCSDLWIWYLIPSLFKNTAYFDPQRTGTPIVVTADKFLAQIPFRLVPPLLNQNQGDKSMRFEFSPQGLEEDIQSEISNYIEKINSSSDCQPKDLAKMEKLKLLYLFALDMVNEKEKIEIINTWVEWLGYDVNYLLEL